jgi:hypothetical protein
MERAAPDSPGNGPLLKKSLLGGADTSHLAPKEPMQAPRDGAVAQAKIELLVDDIACNVGILIATLNVALAMRDAGDTTGLLYALRRAKAYWRAISASAARPKLPATRCSGNGSAADERCYFNDYGR